MARVDDLQKKYPGVPREVIVKWEALRNGIKDTGALDKVSIWTRGGSFQSRDMDVSIKEIAAKRPETVRQGYVMRPGVLYMKNAIGARVMRDSQSPYEIRDVGDGRFALFEGEERVEEVYFPPRKDWADELVTSKGTPVTSLVSMDRRCFSIYPVRFCEYFTQGVQCKFCNYNSTYEDARSAGTAVPTAINLDETVEAYKIIASSMRLVEGRFQMGGLKDREQEGKVYIDFVEQIASGASYTPNMCISTQPMSRRTMQRLKDVGLACVNFNIEVWDRKMFAEVCPGKSNYNGYDRYLEAHLEAVEVFGTGNVGCNFVGGVSLMPENGHKTWQESRDSLIEGIRWLIKNGVFPGIFSLRLGLGSVYGDTKANRAKLAPTEYYLDVGLAHHKAMSEFDLYQKLNKFLFCPMDCLAAFYVGELGMIELAGNPANWLAGTIPNEWNWLSKFVASLESPTLS
ncbi:MAG: hypothetical protein Q7O66_07535 [Dehalococcoidia bacterium]|nr:hypothetical protein [Dehalococcoidia bacterium]